MRSLESDLLHKALNAKPPGIIALGERTLMSKVNQELVNGASILVYLEYDIQSLVNLLKRSSKKCPEKWPNYQIESPTLIDDISSILESRLPGYRKADFVVHGAGESVAKLATNIVKLLDL